MKSMRAFVHKDPKRPNQEAKAVSATHDNQVYFVEFVRDGNYKQAMQTVIEHCANHKETNDGPIS